MSDDSKNNEIVQHAMQELFDANENMATIGLTKNGVVAYHFGENGGMAINPAYAEIVINAVKQLSELQENSG
ncbi:hypothetical protein H4J38_06820 [Colwellia sp. BRX10-3]|jgi:uncharacterized Fe-S center protein|uniref:hypothetical protein n=1 Tax=Colwellia sp. BRX10-3 TaxID=2759844 RepID=UPI0015F35E31|nr:hypothetical protein [Colwellia sp. BRX10-3]MBA6390495.1 hypothetical protein [Colwellia sp. BRX10-3]